ncbi:MAG: hypothetical protein DMD79_02120 [Candidatus Rokuibacteriota bacterium]|nr:MAG: hypothetical protein DMD79_02120 [Candidatus Rokubacteria bacterium]
MRSPPPGPKPGATPDPKAILESLERAFVSVAEQVMPAVVHIEATLKEPARDRGGEREPRERERSPERREFERRFREFFGEEPERFFRQRPAEPRESRSQGSGVIRSIYAVMKPEPRGGGQ